jgi:hypothetical protein
LAITHAKVSTVPDSGDTDDVQMSDWNDDHVGGELAGAVAAHEADTSAVHAASSIAASSTTLVGTATDVQGVLEELDDAVATDIAALATHAAAADPHAVYQLETAVTTTVTFAKLGVLAITTGPLRWYNKTGRTLTFTNVTASVGTAPANQAVLVDVNVDGTTIFSTQSNRPSITAATNTAETTTFNTATITTGAHYITVDIDQVGTTTLGSDLTVTIWMSG